MLERLNQSQSPKSGLFNSDSESINCHWFIKKGLNPLSRVYSILIAYLPSSFFLIVPMSQSPKSGLFNSDNGNL